MTDAKFVDSEVPGKVPVGGVRSEDRYFFFSPAVAREEYVDREQPAYFRKLGDPDQTPRRYTRVGPDPKTLIFDERLIAYGSLAYRPGEHPTLVPSVVTER